MAKLSEINPAGVEALRGIVDFYKYKCILPVARSWPRKIKPPYTILQAQAQIVFGRARQDLGKLTYHMTKEWQNSFNGKRAAWTDAFVSVVMHYWKMTRNYPLIATDFAYITTDTDIQVKWYIYEKGIEPDAEENYYWLQTSLISKTAFETIQKPIFYTLYDDAMIREGAPIIALSEI